jgi:excisionase family DNA binding protein
MDPQSPSPKQRRRVYTPAELSLQTGKPVHTLYRLVRLGRLPFVRIGRSILFPKLAIDRLLSGEVTDDISADR